LGFDIRKLCLQHHSRWPRPAGMVRESFRRVPEERPRVLGYGSRGDPTQDPTPIAKALSADPPPYDSVSKNDAE
jgi:hypothetical protein